jgi:hypothetical protein
MNESIPSSVQPAHAPQKPTICVRLSGVRVRRPAAIVGSNVRGMNVFLVKSDARGEGDRASAGKHRVLLKSLKGAI